MNKISRFCSFRFNLLFTALIFHASQLSAQPDFTGVLVNKETKQPVPYATIKVLHKPYGAWSTEKGFFDLPASRNDSLLITCIGYASLTIPAVFDTIYLEPANIQLPAVTVGNSRPVNEVLGLKGHVDFMWGPSGFGEEFAQKIDVNADGDDIVQINKISVPVKGFDPEYPVLVHIYSVDKNSGLPGKEMLTRTIVINKTHYKKGKLIVDLQNENLIVTEKQVFVSFQWLGYGRKMNHKPTYSLLKLTSSINKGYTWSRNLANESFAWFPAPRYNDRITNMLITVDVTRFHSDKAVAK